MRVKMYLSAGGANGSADSFDTGWLALDLPPGSQVRNAAGLPIAFLSHAPPVLAVAEPATHAMLVVGLVALAVALRRRPARSQKAT